MLTNLNPAAANFVASLNRIEQRLAAANAQVTSGKRMNVASDAPDEVGPLLQLRTLQEHNAQLQSNLALAKTDADSADNALNGAATVMDTIIQLATQGANATQTADTRATLAQQVGALQEQMVAFSQTQVQGRYIFSGDLDQAPAYQFNPASLSLKGVDQLSNAAASRRIEHPAGGSFVASRTAQQIFDATEADGVTPSVDNVFYALNSLRLALLANDQAGVVNTMDSLHKAADHLNSADAFYGTVQGRIQDATTFASNYEIQLRMEISGKQDADIPSAAMELIQASTQLQAAFTAQAKMPNSTLFNYLG